MKNIVQRLLFMIFSEGCFVTAMLTTQHGLQSVCELQTQIKQQIEGNPIIYRASYDAQTECQVSWQELAARMLNGPETDVSIDGYEIESESFDYNTFDFTRIRKNDYEVVYQYDPNGSICKVCYVSR